MVDNCKHVNKIKNSLELGILQPERWQCLTCFTTESVWACLSCNHIACGRYISEHALVHYHESNHPLCIEVNEKFVFCYECDDYILNDNASSDIKLIRMALDAVSEQEFNALRQVKGGKRILRSKLVCNPDLKSRRLLQADHIQTALVKLRLARLSSALRIWRQAFLNKHASLATAKVHSSRIKKRYSATISTNNNCHQEQQLHIHKRKLIPYSGLRNLGNTCYINSVLQVLSHTAAFSNFIVTHPPEATVPELRNVSVDHRRITRTTNCFDLVDAPKSVSVYPQSERLLQKQNRQNGNFLKKIFKGKYLHQQQKKDSTTTTTKLTSTPSNVAAAVVSGVGGLNGGSTLLQCPEALTYAAQPATTLYEELHALFQVLWSGQRAVVSPHSLLYALWLAVPSFKGYKQQDAQEFLSVLLDKMQTEIQPRGEKWDPKWQNFITRAFQGTLESLIRCCNCQYEVKNEEPFLDLSLAFPSPLPNSTATQSNNNNEVSCSTDTLTSSLFSSSSSSSFTTTTTTTTHFHLNDLLNAFSAETPIESYENLETTTINKLDDELSSIRSNSASLRPTPTRMSRRLRETSISSSNFTRLCYACPRCCDNSQFNYSTSSVIDDESDNQSFVDHPGPFVAPVKHHHSSFDNDHVSSLTTTTATTTAAQLKRGKKKPVDKNDCGSASYNHHENNNEQNVTNEEKTSPHRLVEATQTLKISRLPKVLRLHLKRFRWIGRQREKINTHVDFPEVLDLKQLCTSHLQQMYLLATEQESTASFNYQLTGVVVHHGKGFQSGHYTCYCLNDDNDAWLHYNDSHVTPCQISDVLRAQAYILVYSQLMPSSSHAQLMKSKESSTSSSHSLLLSPNHNAPPPLSKKRRCQTIK